jgi:NTE family protein
MSTPLRFGVVLTGGGARAAYQVGVVRALSQLPVEIVAISAVGSGALNGAILAASATPGEAVERLATLWAKTVLSPGSALSVGPVPVLGLGVYLTMLFGGGVTPQIAETLQGAASTAHGMHAHGRSARKTTSTGDVVVDVLKLLVDSMNLSTDAELDRYLAQELAAAAARPARPFFVSVYETDEGLLETFKLGLRGVGLMQGSAPVYHEISSRRLSAEERLRYVLASATLPFLCESEIVRGQRYIDGSFGGMKRSPGAVPLEPLRRRDDLDAILVVHTETGVSWDATDFPGVQIIELRPTVDEHDAGVGYFWADATSLRQWMAIGERDANAKLRKVFDQLAGWSAADEAKRRLRLASESLDE